MLIAPNRDTLNRHLQVHDKHRPPPTSRKKACVPCFRSEPLSVTWHFQHHDSPRRSKIRCLAEQPSCSSCLKRRVNCLYDLPSRRHQDIRPPSVSGEQSQYTTTPSDFSPRNIENGVPSPFRHDVGLLSPSSGPDNAESRFDETYVNPTGSAPVLDGLAGSFTDYSKMFADPATFNFFEEPTLESNLDWIFNNFPDEVFPSIPSSPRMSSNSVIEQVQERAG
jgi:hypothetical protein